MFSRRPGHRFNRGRIATAVAAASTAVSPPPLAGYAIWFDPDNPDLVAYNPNYRYPGHAEPGALGGNWAQATYNSRIKRDHTFTCNGGTLARSLAWSDGASSRSLTHDGAKSTYRFLHDGTGGVTIQFVITPRATDAVSNYFQSSTTATGVGFRLVSVAGQQQITFSVGNGAATCLTVTSTAGEFSTWLPHLVSVTLHTYGGIGTLGATIRIDNGTPVTANWSAAPGAGDSAGTLQIGGTFNAHLGALVVYSSLLTMGDADDTALKSYLQTRFVGTPDPWQPPVWGRLVVEGDSIPTGSGGTPICEQITLSRPFDYSRQSTAGHTVITNIDTAGNKTTINNLYDAARPFNLLFLDAGTNDFVASATAANVHAAWDDFITGMSNPWDGIILCNVRFRDGFTDPQETEALAYNALLVSDTAGADQVIDVYTLTSTEFIQPTWWADSIHPTTLGNAQSVPAVQTALNTYVPAVVVPPTYDYINNDGTTVGWFDLLDPTSYTQAAGVLTALTEKISGAACTLAGSPVYEATGLYGHPTVHCDATNDAAHTTAAALVAAGQSNTSNYTLHFLLRCDIADLAGVFGGWALSGSSTNKQTFGQSSFSSGRYDTRLNGVSTNGTAATSADMVVASYVMAGTSLTMYVTTHFATTAVDASSPQTIDPGGAHAPNRFGLWATVDAAFDTFFDGCFGELVVKSTNNDAAAVARVANAMLRRWS